MAPTINKMTKTHIQTYKYVLALQLMVSAHHRYMAPHIPLHPFSSLCVWVWCHRETSLPGHLTRQLCHHVSGADARDGRVHQGAVASRDAHLHLPTAWPECVQRGFSQLHRARPHWAIHHGGAGTGRWGCVQHEPHGLGWADWLLTQTVSFPWMICPLDIQLPLGLCLRLASASLTASIKMSTMSLLYGWCLYWGYESHVHARKPEKNAPALY